MCLTFTHITISKPPFYITSPLEVSMTIRSKIENLCGYAAGFAVGLASSLYAQDAQITPPKQLDFQSKSWEYQIQKTKFPITLLGLGDYRNVQTLDGALAVIKRDDEFAVLLAGEFTEPDKDLIKRVLTTIHGFNPPLVKKLEPVIILTGRSSFYGSISNSPQSFSAAMDTFRAKDGGIKPLGDNSNPTLSYTDQLSKYIKIPIPTSQEEFERFYADTLKQLTEVKDGLDIILTDMQGVERALVHEFGHLSVGETPEGRSLARKIEQIPDEVERTSFSKGHVDKRRREVEDWAGIEYKNLETMVQTWENSTPEQRETLKTKEKEGGKYVRIEQALSRMTREELLGCYKKLICVHATFWGSTERIAEDCVEVISGSEACQAAQSDQEGKEELDLIKGFLRSQ